MAGTRAQVERRVGVVGAVEAGPLPLAVVGRRALLDEADAGAAELVAAQERLEVGLRRRRVGADPQAHDDEPVEAAGRLRVERDAEAHAVRDRALEVDHPAQLVGDVQAASLDPQLVGRIGARVGADGERRRNRLPQLVHDQPVAEPAVQDEPVRQHPRPRRLGP